MLAICSATFVCTGQQWFWQNPLPQGNSLYAGQVIDANTIVCVGGAGTFLRSTNAGATWTIFHYIAGTSTALWGVSFADTNIGTVVGGNGIILRTFDGGTSWIVQNSTTTRYLADVTFTDADTGTAVGEYGTILRTTDGGITWEDQSFGTEGLSGVSFADGNTGAAIGGYTLLRTTDGGTTWKNQTSGVTVGLTDVCFTDANTGTAVGDNGTIIRTTDGGETWVSQNRTTATFNGVSFINENTGVVVAGSPAVLRTTNGGGTWLDVAPGGEHSLYDVSLHSSNLGFLAGEDGAMYQSLDAGSTWQELSSGNTISVNGLTFLDAAIGIAVGAGLVFRTSDGGTNWVTQTSTGLLQSVWFSDTENGTAVGWGGSNGVILRTTDRGITWHPLPSPGGNLYAVHYADSLNGIAVGDRIIVKTVDGGITWQVLHYGTIPFLSDVYMINSSIAIAVGADIRRTSDGGLTWQIISTPVGGANGVDFVDANRGVAVGAAGTIIRTTDGGLTWTTQVSNTINDLRAVRFNPSGTEGIAVGSSGTILRTIDTGITWTNELSPTLNTLLCVSPTSYTGWTTGGNEGAILHRASSVFSLPVVLAAIEIDSLNMIVPAEGDTFAYQMTFSNTTLSPQTVDVWTKIVTPIGFSIDPLYGPETLSLDPFETVVIDTAQMGVPFDARSGMYSLIAFVGTYQVDTLDSDTTTFIKLPSVPCEDISQFQARCRSGGTVQARVILTDNSHTGDRVEFTIDDVPYEASVTPNGRASLILPGFVIGPYTVELTEPPGCFDPIVVTCSAGLTKQSDEWEDGLQEVLEKGTPSTTALLGNYPNPFNPTTEIRFRLADNRWVSLRVHDLLGREVATLVDGYLEPGFHKVMLDGSRLSSGLYFYKLSTGDFSAVKKLVLVK